MQADEFGDGWDSFVIQDENSGELPEQDVDGTGYDSPGDDDSSICISSISSISPAPHEVL